MTENDRVTMNEWAKSLFLNSYKWKNKARGLACPARRRVMNRSTDE